MKAKFISTKGEGLRAKIEIDGHILSVMDEFYGEDLEANSEILIELADSSREEKSWEDLLTENVEQKNIIIQIKDWSYFVYGKVISVDPVLCDCGVAEIECPIDSSDDSFIDEYIGFKVNVLTAFEYYEYEPTPLDLALDEYSDKNYEEALTLLLPLAESNDSLAQLYTARIYYYGYGTEQNYELAAEWLERSANHANSTAQCFIGALYREGIGVKQSYSRARMWYQSAAKLGSRRAKSSLGWIYLKGLGVSKNFGKALTYLEEAADCEDSYGTGLLGYFYEHGIVVKQDFNKAVELYTSAKDLGDIHSYYNLGLAYYHGRGVIKNRREALKLIKYASEKGNSDASNFLTSHVDD